MIAKKFMLATLLLVSGCTTEQSRWRFTSSGNQSGGPRQSATNTREWVKNATEMSEDLKSKVIQGKLSPAEATRIENDRRNEKTRQVQYALDEIKKNAREEYAATRPEPIKDAILKEQLCLGMDEKDVLVCLGQPTRKTRTVSRRGASENWTYTRLSVWFEAGVVTGWREEE